MYGSHSPLEHHERDDVESSWLAGEEQIVWLEEIESKDYVRQLWHDTRSRTGRIRYRGDGRTVGYSTLRKTEHSDETGFPGIRSFYRRVFYLTPHDRDTDPAGSYRKACPDEAVDPRTIKPGVLGVKTERARGAVCGD